MEWVGILGALMVILALFGFYLGVPLGGGKVLRKGGRRKREQH